MNIWFVRFAVELSLAVSFLTSRTDFKCLTTGANPWQARGEHPKPTESTINQTWHPILLQKFSIIDLVALLRHFWRIERTTIILLQ